MLSKIKTVTTNLFSAVCGASIIYVIPQNRFTTNIFAVVTLSVLLAKTIVDFIDERLSELKAEGEIAAEAIDALMAMEKKYV